jgi:hypothetical protein
MDDEEEDSIMIGEYEPLSHKKQAVSDMNLDHNSVHLKH